LINQVRVGHKYVNISVAITNDEGVAFDSLNAEAWFYKISQVDGTISLDTNINGTGKVGLSKQDGQTGFYGASIDISSFLETEYVILYKVTAESTETITVEYFSIDSSKYLIADIWNYATRTLTSINNVVSSIWNYITRTLTAGTKDLEIDAIKTETDKIQPEIINNKNEFKADVSDLATSASISVLETLIKRIIGLSQENFRILNPIYDGNHNLLSANIKIYANKTDCENDQNPIASYSMIATYNVDNEMTSYKVVKN